MAPSVDNLSALYNATKKSYRIGVDVGGTNSDAVLVCDAEKSSPNCGVVAHYKTATTVDVTDGIEVAISQVLKSSNVDPSQIAVVVIGTTHFINAVVEQDQGRLDSVAVIRLSAHFTRSTPPFSDFPPALKQIMCGYYAFCAGGCNIDGDEIASICPDELRAEARKIRDMGLRTVVLTGVYSPIDETFLQEENAREIMSQEVPELVIVCSRDIANVGLLERENAAILNASILRFAQRTIRGFKAVLKRLDLSCGLYLTQNDGTIVSGTIAAKLPIKTFSSGATNSMRGAAYLSREARSGKDGNCKMIVVDIGGTTADVGMLLPSGFPRQASAFVSIEGVRINYSMPHVTSIGLGGGSIVRSTKNGVTVGPDSVGYKLSTEALVFGGGTQTASDIAVRNGNAKMGSIDLVQGISLDFTTAAQEKVCEMLTNVVDLMKTSPEPIPVLLVGGGSIIAPDSLPGASVVIRPPFHDVANAVGASIARVSGTVDCIEDLADRSLQDVIARCTAKAKQRAIEAGADEHTISVAELDTIPIQYTANRIRVIVKCVGDLDITNLSRTVQDDSDDLEDFTPARPTAKASSNTRELDVDMDTYKPTINKNREWVVSEIDLKLMSMGCYVLGCAGGGSPYPEYLQLRDMLRAGHVLRIAEVEAFKDCETVLWGGHMGSPAVSVERLGAEEVVDAMRELLDYTRTPSYSAVMSLEIGGGNGLQPLIMGSSKFFDRPCLDADWMGRAYPTYWQTTICVYERDSLVPAAIASGDGKNMIMTKASNDRIVDTALRAACTEMGSRVGMAVKPTTVDRVRKYAVLNTMSLAWRIGRAIYVCQRKAQVMQVADRIIDQVGGPTTAKKLFAGKIVEVESKVSKGHSYGSITIEPLSKDADEGAAPCFKTDGLLRIPFKNENILAEWESPAGVREIIASVPDLVCVLDSQSGENLGVPEFRYGLRVTVLGITASPRWTDTPAGLELGGPQAFGYDFEYKPLGVYVEPKSVIAEASDFGQGANLLGNPSYGYRQGGLPNMPEYPIAMNDLKKPKFAVIGDDGSVTTDSPKAEQPEASSRHTSQAVERPTLPAVAILDDKESEAGGWASAETHRPHQDQQLPRFGGQPPSGFQRPNTVSAAQLSMPGQQQYGSDPFARQPRFARPPPGSYDNQPPRRLPEPPRQQLQQPYQQQQQQSQSNYSVPNSGGRPQPGASDRNVQQRPRWQETQDRSTPFSQRPPPLVAPQPRAPVPDWRQVGERFPEESVRTDTPDHTTLPPYPASSPGRSRNDSPDILSDIYGQYNDQPASGRFR
ncbi:hypothetical protein BCR37DRAFT_390741 [Protomyces lactucae-debilis]|uniref:Hydantoinase/oxoprolinase-domain-containing protein n=1 Tax=Protomyces lactucae-debilis TaxID=2754530 RepID=A0A1Y2FSP8_PROLT|nr:uncharacterized protein BCR37DRAFT_390741 [Protomyces lactucae-debilis]ORY87023.1 hypothetical protein BCR37DRAFT_390741 [Protomyces lactucae-debilis]